jgi:hypothetical protein
MSNNNQTPFQAVNSRGKTRKNINTQLNAINCLSPDLLNGILQRFRSQAIVNEIQQLRVNHPELDAQMQIQSSIIPNSKKYKASLYINYKLSGHEVFHFSFHLCPTSTNRSNSGLIHVKQTTNSYERVLPLRIQHRASSDSILFSLGTDIKYKQPISDLYKLEGRIICEVLNMYFDTQNTAKYIGTPLQKKNKNLTKINAHKSSALSNLKTTRKR